ncbi:DEAD/DEAH box helicase [Granulicella sp. WH15]|uniref:EcoAI/FtnUII family type I restriction enzme subunit R n=1 Tax=Granulicella sp. WH15 TaxID=2602070 RepID=UPI00136734F8|nr:type I restriction endonuclease subunit R [Granulicella sp. WH15]QHN02763.1 DEAD/DEAH box helicase [Granulicella sp. WH15]
MRNESETRAELIDPALRAAGWGVVAGSRVLREFKITQGRLIGAGRRTDPDTADYILVYQNRKLAVIEAKREDLSEAEGVAQAKHYAGKMAVRFAYATNGHKIYRMDLGATPVQEPASIEEPDGPVAITTSEGLVDHFPTPDELWAATFAVPNAWRERFSQVPFEDRSGSWDVRYYQDTAIQRVLEAIADERQRILLTLATGTGKTAIAFQIAWKLFHAKWNLSHQPTRRPRILFLADRNILADQAYNSFSSFADDARIRIAPDSIRKSGKVPTNASIFFTIFQTFMSGTGPDSQPAPYFGQYPPDFFDFIIIDECHRGGANDESNWRSILDYFAPAVQLGLTATPKRRDNVDTYAYFGEPVYIYSLKEGINDGFLTPFKVVQVSTTLDDYVYTPDDTIVEGEVEEGRRYTESDFNRIIEIKEREEKRVSVLMERIDQREKTIVFCATQLHAAAIRDLINQKKTSTDPMYCCRVTANDGALGDQYLREFQDNEKTIPTILTTSQKLSTGVDARNVRNIVLLRPVNSMIEFKQIIGRGTRLFDGKNFFTIYDFVRAHHLFNDPEWDGEPLDPEPDPEPRLPQPPVPPPDGEQPEGEDDPVPRRERLVIRLADGKAREIQHMTATSFWSADGRPISANQFLESLFGTLPEFFKDEDELRKIWSKPDTRRALLRSLEGKGFDRTQLAEIQRSLAAEQSDLYDVLAYIAFALPRATRQERADRARPSIQATFPEKQQTFLDFVLSQYVTEGVEELDQDKLSPLLILRYNAISDAILELGAPPEIRDMFVGFQQYLY